jgi:hypothetical protein
MKSDKKSNMLDGLEILKNKEIGRLNNYLFKLFIPKDIELKKFPKGIYIYEFDIIKFNKLYTDFFNYVKEFAKNNCKNFTINEKDEKIIKNIFRFWRSINGTKNTLKYELIACLKSLERIMGNIKYYSENKYLEKLYAELRILYNVFKESLYILNLIKYGNEYYKKSLYPWRDIGKDIINDFFNIYLFLSPEKLKINKISLSNSLSIASFILRSCIEERIRQILCIKNAYIETKNKIIAIKLNNMLEIIKNNEDVNIILPVKLYIIKKIYRWLSNYIHDKRVPKTWEIEWSIYILEPFFIDEKIKIKNTFLNDIDLIKNDLKIMYKNLKDIEIFVIKYKKEELEKKFNFIIYD